MEVGQDGRGVGVARQEGALHDGGDEVRPGTGNGLLGGEEGQGCMLKPTADEAD